VHVKGKNRLTQDPFVQEQGQVVNTCRNTHDETLFNESHQNLGLKNKRICWPQQIVHLNLLDNVYGRQIYIQGSFIMSEIRPANNRPDIPRVQQDRPVKTEQKKEEPAQRTEAQREVPRQAVQNTQKTKGGNVDITV
jgi:hypothetical protein